MKILAKLQQVNGNSEVNNLSESDYIKIEK